MELGATVCLPGAAPLCGECPLSFLCRARGEGDPTRYPVKSPKKARRREEHTVFVLESGGSVALAKRPPRGLLASLWQFPMAPGHLDRAEAQKTAEQWGLSLIQFCALPPSKHIFTHIEWEMNGYLMRVEEPAGDFVWADLQELETVYAIPSAFAPFLTAAKNLLDSGHFPAL